MLVCELMEGGSCHDLLRRGALTWADGGVDIAKDVVRGLSYLHQNRIAHLDIKSGNVLLTRCAPPLPQACRGSARQPSMPVLPLLRLFENSVLP
jgi:hypothetical protein